MTAHQAKNPVPGLNMLEHGAQADANADAWIGIVGLPGRQREACARALGLDAEAATALLLGLQARNATPDVRGDDQPTAATSLPQPDAVTEPTQTRPPAITRAVHEAACLPTLLAQHPRLQVLGFYLPPWEAFLEACEESGEQSAGQIEAWMRAWSQCHQKLLAARQAAPDRVFLINAGRMEQPEGLKFLLQRMGAALSDRLPAGESIPRLPINAALSRLLASQMAETGREYWELYESLESCAVLFERKPEFQATVDLVDASDLMSLLASLCEIQQTFVDAKGLDPAGWHDSGKSQPPATHLLDEVQLENELLGLQLHQLYEELDYHIAYVAELRGIVNQAGQAAEEARLVISKLASPSV